MMNVLFSSLETSPTKSTSIIGIMLATTRGCTLQQQIWGQTSGQSLQMSLIVRVSLLSLVASVPLPVLLCVQILNLCFWQAFSHLLSRSNFSEFPHHEIIHLTASVIVINHFRHLHQKELSIAVACMNWFSPSFGLLLVRRLVKLNMYLWSALRLMA